MADAATLQSIFNGREVIFLEHPQQVCPGLEGVSTGDYITIKATHATWQSAHKNPRGIGTSQKLEHDPL